MALTIASREVDGVTVLDLSGRITLGEGSVQLRDAIRDLISKGKTKILLNLGDVNYIDSSGAATDQAVHRFRYFRRRSQRHRFFQVNSGQTHRPRNYSQILKGHPALAGWPFARCLGCLELDRRYLLRSRTGVEICRVGLEAGHTRPDAVWELQHERVVVLQ